MSFSTLFLPRKSSHSDPKHFVPKTRILGGNWMGWMKRAREARTTTFYGPLRRGVQQMVTSKIASKQPNATTTERNGDAEQNSTKREHRIPRPSTPTYLASSKVFRDLGPPLTTYRKTRKTAHHSLGRIEPWSTAVRLDCHRERKIAHHRLGRISNRMLSTAGRV